MSDSPKYNPLETIGLVAFFLYNLISVSTNKRAFPFLILVIPETGCVQVEFFISQPP